MDFCLMRDYRQVFAACRTNSLNGWRKFSTINNRVKFGNKTTTMWFCALKTGLIEVLCNELELAH